MMLGPLLLVIVVLHLVAPHTYLWVIGLPPLIIALARCTRIRLAFDDEAVQIRNVWGGPPALG